MFRRIWLAALLGLACLGNAQVNPNDNPTIEYTSGAVPAYKAIDDIAKMSEKKIRVAEPISHQPLILRLHNAPYKDVLDWIAAATHGTWVDKDRYKVLTRTNYLNLSILNGAKREKAGVMLDYVQDRQIHAAKEPLTPESTAKFVLALYAKNADRSSEAYKTALLNSADTRLVDRTLVALQPNDLAGAAYPNHAVFSTRARVLQGTMRMSQTEFNQIVAEQNRWTNVLNILAAKRPELKPFAAKRLKIEARSRIVAVFSNPVQGLPTHYQISIVGPGGYPRVRTEGNIDFYQARPRPVINFGTDFGKPALSSVCAEFLDALNAPSAPTLSNDLSAALLAPSETDPLQLVVSDGLNHIADAKNWNLVACVPDKTLLDPAIQSLNHENGLDGNAFVTALANSCDVAIKDSVMIVSAQDPLEAETKRTDRLAMGAYLNSLSRNGYSTSAAEAKLASAMGSDFDPHLTQLYARLIAPAATPYLDTSIDAVALYGSFSPDQRKLFNKGIAFGLSDLTQTQKDYLSDMMLDAPKRILIGKQAQNVPTSRLNPEITDLIDGRMTPGEQLSVAVREETVLRVRGEDAYGRLQDQVFSQAEVAGQLKRQGPWKSLQFATARANTIKLTIRASDATDIVHFIRDYPDGFSALGDFDALPVDMRKALGLSVATVLMKTSP